MNESVSPPSRKAHLEQCRLMAIGAIHEVRTSYEVHKFDVDNWQPAACPLRGQDDNAWAVLPLSPADMELMSGCDVNTRNNA